MAILSLLRPRRAVTSPKRSLVKTLTWRIIAEVDTFVVSYLITGSMRWSIAIVGIESTTKTVLYYLHERAWGRVLWGTSVLPTAAEQSPSSSAVTDSGDCPRNASGDA
ncbi:hypothetical protein MBRA_02608 [Methylobacterium brachiatum]|nr:hypothetical protein MBRA_02608 [Methylobacterium brachiatum]